MSNICFNCLKTVRLVSHYEIHTCISLLSEKATPTLLLYVVHKCDGLDRDQSFDVTVCLFKTMSQSGPDS